MTDFRMPSLGADMAAGTLVEWKVKPGDRVRKGDIIALVDTQKGLIDIEIFEDGIISELLIHEEEKVPVGTIMATINGEEKAGIEGESQEKRITTKETMKEEVSRLSAPRIRASPLARRIAAEKGIDLAHITGTGEEGAITKSDIEKAISAIPPPHVEKPVSSIREAVAAAMTKSNREIPHYYLETKVDMSKALTWLSNANRQRDVKQRLLPVVMIIRAVARALVQVPDLNAYWDEGLQKMENINIGFVISLRTGGVMIPAILSADTKSMDELMTSLNDLIPRARAMKLKSSELSESTFTITSLGESNVETVYGLIYPPQVGIAGFGAIIEQPWAEAGMLDVRPVMNITLAADHRATDGVIGSRFLMSVKNYLQNPEEL